MGQRFPLAAAPEKLGEILHLALIQLGFGMRQQPIRLTA
jgi:hypothetical protein